MDINQFYKKVSPKKFLISYKGVYSQNLLEDILAESEVKLSSMEEGIRLRRRVHSILVEILQNIHHHSKDKNDKSIIFILSKEKDNYSIITGNYIAHDEVKKLQNHLDKINSLNKANLKKLYLDKLYNGTMSKKGGAGLGMLDIARRSGHKLTYEFHKSSSQSYFFCLRVKISTKLEFLTPV